MYAVGRVAAQQHAVTLLESEALIIGGVRFVGATLWTDYAVDGDRKRGPAMARAAREMNDHRAIRWSAASRGPFLPAHALEFHIDSAAVMDELLTRPFDRPTIVVTHHPMSALDRSTLPRQYRWSRPSAPTLAT